MKHTKARAPGVRDALPSWNPHCPNLGNSEMYLKQPDSRRLSTTALQPWKGFCTQGEYYLMFQGESSSMVIYKCAAKSSI